MAPRFVVHFVLSFYDVLNLRETKRKLVEYYSSNALSCGPEAIAWSVASVPRLKTLRKFVRTCFGYFLEGVVADYQARLLIYSASGVRGDGHYDIARRIAIRTVGNRFPERPYTVLLAWCGVDGCLLKPPTPAVAEAFPDIQSDLEPLLRLIREVRLQANLSLLESSPVFHATDSFRKHRSELDSLYRRIWPEVAMATQSVTPRGDAVAIVRDATAGGPTAIVGEPVHTVLKARRLSSVTSNDCADFHFDMQFWADRLSAPAPAGDGAFEAPAELAAGARCELLRKVALSAAEEGLQLIQDASPDVRGSLVSFIKQPALDKAKTWKTVFGAKPGRATIARIARRLGTAAHPSMGLVNYRTLGECWRALRVLRAWYRPGRKQTRRRRGIKRERGASDRVIGRSTVWNLKLEKYFKYLLGRKRTESGKKRVSITLRGLWRWQSVALALRRAGMSVQSGTVPVERLWASMLEMFPDAARGISLEWYRMLAMLFFLRFNFRHFHHKLLPTWSENDALLAEKLENVCAAARAMREEEGEATLAPLLDAFR